MTDAPEQTAQDRGYCARGPQSKRNNPVCNATSPPVTCTWFENALPLELLPPNVSDSSIVRRILLVEDNPDDQCLLEEAFDSQQLRVEVDAVPDGEELVARLGEKSGAERARYDLILLDAHLPKRSAEEILTAFEEKGGLGVRCVVVSSVMMEAQRAQFLKLGAMAVLTKPLDIDEYAEFAREIYSLSDPREW
jgi:CheY-like chemotaxis protein